MFPNDYAIQQMSYELCERRLREAQQARLARLVGTWRRVRRGR